MPNTVIEPGDTLHGYCGGLFGRDSYGDKVVLAVGRDWIVARDAERKQVVLATGDDVHAELAEFLEPERYDDVSLPPEY